VANPQQVLQCPLSTFLQSDVDLGIRHHIRLKGTCEGTGEVRTKRLGVLCQLQNKNIRCYDDGVIEVLTVQLILRQQKVIMEQQKQQSHTDNNEELILIPV
jgi:hypothetical protein